MERQLGEFNKTILVKNTKRLISAAGVAISLHMADYHPIHAQGDCIEGLQVTGYTPGTNWHAQAQSLETGQPLVTINAGDKNLKSAPWLGDSTLGQYALRVVSWVDDGPKKTHVYTKTCTNPVAVDVSVHNEPVSGNTSPDLTSAPIYNPGHQLVLNLDDLVVPVGVGALLVGSVMLFGSLLAAEQNKMGRVVKLTIPGPPPVTREVRLVPKLDKRGFWARLRNPRKVIEYVERPAP